MARFGLRQRKFLSLCQCLFFLFFALSDNVESQDSCEFEGSPKQVDARYIPGVITVDGNSSDWANVPEVRLLMKRVNGAPMEYPEGSSEMVIKALHDGSNIFIMVQIPGPYYWEEEAAKYAPAVSLIFGVGVNASLYNMGGCTQLPGKCSPSTCRGHEVDLIQFKINTAIPGRIYGGIEGESTTGSGQDRIGQLNDMYGFNPHCKYFDSTPVAENEPNATLKIARNDWRGSWSHSIIDTTFGLVKEDAPFGDLGLMGDYTFEFVRPLRTNDEFQQDVQFSIGQSHRFGAASWFPYNTIPWRPSQHYVVGCEWLNLHLHHGKESGIGDLSVTAQGSAVRDSDVAWIRLTSNTALIVSFAACLLVVLSGLVLRSGKEFQFSQVPQGDSL